MKVRVRKHIPLPHTLKYKNETYTFMPDADIPDESYAAALLKNQPQTYEEAKGKPDIDAYNVQKVYKDNVLSTMIAALSNEEQGKVIDFINKLQSEKEAAEKQAKLDEEKRIENDLRKKAQEDLKNRRANDKENANRTITQQEKDAAQTSLGNVAGAGPEVSSTPKR